MPQKNKVKYDPKEKAKRIKESEKNTDINNRQWIVVNMQGSWDKNKNEVA